MMRVRELERLLAKHGVGVAKLDAVTRKLRESGYLPKSGRGPNAPHIGTLEAARVLVAVAGSAKGTEAAERLAKLDEARSADAAFRSKALTEALAYVLGDPAKLDDVALVRVGRTSRYADIMHANGNVTAFRTRKPRPDRFQVEGILPAGLLKIVARELAQSTPAARDPEKSDG